MPDVTASRLDHIAVETADLEQDVSAWCDHLGYTVIRRGTNVQTGRGIALLRGPDGSRIEMLGVTETTPSHAHLAYRVDDVEEEARRLSSTSFALEMSPIAIEASQAISAIVRSPGGIRVQLIKYAPASPDF